MSKNEFVQLAGCAKGYVISKDGVVKSASGKTLQHSPDGKVTVKRDNNGKNWVCYVSDLLDRNFVALLEVNAADSEAVNAVESNEIAELVPDVTQEREFMPVSNLCYFSIDEMEAEIKRRKLQFIDEVVEILNKAKADYGSEIVVAAVNKSMGD